VYTLIHPDEVLLVDLYGYHIRLHSTRPRRAVRIGTLEIGQVIQSRIIFQIGIHSKTSSLIFPKNVFIDQRIISPNCLLIGALPAG
jgi:hypothetical protein